ncbi:serine hydrolase domain-containing protein [Rhodoligotrophos defluvii]|uniref:serine hydrolase domain-containing protein n=1 Tax=Rhodoligotrophos defluvii TaxID=2561934 RepID=UPI0010C94F61|nr:serine hydrolase [Rhodoligotrophos defluvii]
MRRLLCLILFIGLLTPAAGSAQEERSPPSVEDRLTALLDRAEALSPLETVVIAHEGEIIAERGYRGHSADAPANIKSASKSVMSALIGIAIDKGVLKGVDQKIAPILRDDLPPDPDPRIEEITIGHLLSMQAGLGRTSGPNYGRWVASANWVRSALAQPFVDDPGGDMLYSTGSTHLLSAILTRLTGRSTLALARDWLEPLAGFEIADWERDPQGIYLGGNQMAMSPKSLLAFGELYRNGGRTRDGKQLISEAWIEQSWQARTSSRYTGDGYGYGWFSREIGGKRVHYAWGFGGQMLYIVPELNLTVVMTSQATQAAARNGHRSDLHQLLSEIIAIFESSPA